MIKTIICFVCIVLVGCKSQPKRPTVKMPPLPMVTKARSQQVQAAIIVVPPQPINLAWNKGETTPGTITEIYSTTDLTTPIEQWQLVGETTGTNISLPKNKPQEFFAIRNYLNGEYSDWARK